MRLHVMQEESRRLCELEKLWSTREVALVAVGNFKYLPDCSNGHFMHICVVFRKICPLS